jgi:hypothetical protein
VVPVEQKETGTVVPVYRNSGAGRCKNNCSETVLYFSRLLMIYREQPGRAVSGEAAHREQALTGADWPGFYLSASFRL